MKKLIAFVLMLAAGAVQAAGTCYQWRQGGLSWVGSADQATDEFVAWCNSSDANKDSCMSIGNHCAGAALYTCQAITATVTISSFPTGTSNLTMVETRKSDGQVFTQTRSVAITTRTNPEGCPDCPAVGTKTSLTGSGFTIPTTTCNGGCMYKQAGGVSVILQTLGGWASDFSSTGLACQASTGAGSSTAEKAGCKMVDGVLICPGANGDEQKNCYTYNGEVICSDYLPNGCIKTSAGAVVCAKGTPPTSTDTPAGGAPNNGTPSTPATPTATQTTNTSGDPNSSSNPGTDYYAPATVNGSAGGTSESGGGTATGTGPGSSTSGSSGSSGSSSSGASGSASGGDDCTAPPSCSGDPIACRQLALEWNQQCPGAVSGTDLATAIGTDDGGTLQDVADIDVSSSSSITTDRFGSTTGTCPGPYSISILGTAFSYDPMAKVCEFGSILRALVLLFAYIAAFRIISGSL